MMCSNTFYRYLKMVCTNHCHDIYTNTQIAHDFCSTQQNTLVVDLPFTTKSSKFYLLKILSYIADLLYKEADPPIFFWLNVLDSNPPRSFLLPNTCIITHNCFVLQLEKNSPVDFLYENYSWKIFLSPGHLELFLRSKLCSLTLCIIKLYLVSHSHNVHYTSTGYGE